jgi:hypothetical protein
LAVVPQLIRVEAHGVGGFMDSVLGVGLHIGDAELAVTPGDDADVTADVPRAARVSTRMPAADAYAIADCES